MESYNLFLYHRRLAMGLKMREFARRLGIGLLRYSLIENGYLKPGKKDVERIGRALDTDYAPYLEGEYSYPGEKDDVRKKMLRVFDAIGSRPFRIVMLSLATVCLGFLIFSRVLYYSVNYEKNEYYTDGFSEFYDALIERGEPGYSIVNSMTCPELYCSEPDRFRVIRGEYAADRYGMLNYQSVLWTDTFRCILSVSSEHDGEFLFSADIVDLETRKSMYGLYDPADGPLFFGTDVKPEYEEAIREMADGFFDGFDGLISEKLSMDLSSRDLLAESLRTNEELNGRTTQADMMFLGSVILGLLMLFGFVYSVVYGTKHGVERDFGRGLQIFHGGVRKPKRDIRFFPFIPETVFEIIGIALLALANVRFQIYLMLAFLPSGLGMGIETIRTIYDLLMLLFYAGMFLLYFIDFDLFMDDKRVIRNIVMYSFVFIGLYCIEQIFLNSMNADSLLFSVIEFRLPNMFGTIAMYFLIMYLLYFTPKFVNTRTKLIVFRSLSVIPVLVIFGTYVIFNGANTSFGWDLPNWAYYLFASERIPFSLLCVSYLFGVYFLRLFFKWKYGDAVAANYFNGNRFLFLKNVLSCVIVLVISAFDFIMSLTPGAKAWGFGYAYCTVFLIPLLLFYHPHKGPRNRVVDYVVLVLYFLAFTGILSFLFMEVI